MRDGGYYRWPSVHGDWLFFVSEDDIWRAPLAGGRAERLTAGRGGATRPWVSPDGQHVAFSGREEGDTEVYVMSAAGGPVRRLTWLGAPAAVCGWSPGGDIVFASSTGRPFPRWQELFTVAPEGGESVRLPYGLANAVAYDASGALAIGRNIGEPAHWKRYRGGTVGQIWLDPKGSGDFKRVELDGNLASPTFAGGRLFFLSDHEGVGNVYSVTPDGADLRRHTDHEEFYARGLQSDGETLVYFAGGDLYRLQIGHESEQVEVAYPGQRTQRERRFVEAGRYLEDYDLHAQGHRVAITARGQLWQMGTWEGPAVRVGLPAARVRLGQFLGEGGDMVAVVDVEGEEQLAVLDESGAVKSIFEGLELGLVTELSASPDGTRVAVATVRRRLHVVEVATGTASLAAESAFGQIRDLSWSPAGRYLACSLPDSERTTAIMVYDRQDGELHRATQPVLADVRPAFDPEGRYLYFLSERVFNPVRDQLVFDLGFPHGMRPYLVTLRGDLRSPFAPLPEPESKPADGADADKAAPGQADERPSDPEIDFAGMPERIVAFPVKDGIYGQIAGYGGKVLYTVRQAEGELGQDSLSLEPDQPWTLMSYDFRRQREDKIAEHLTSFLLDSRQRRMALRSGRQIRVLAAGAKPDEKAGDVPGRESGVLDIGRIKVSVEPGAEWEQMLRETWRLMRENYWSEDMCGVDWPEVYRRYQPLVQRVSTRGELSDVIWEMQGEIGTSHAYELFGDYREAPNYHVGQLGADFRWDGAGYRIERLPVGDGWDERYRAPLRAPGVDVRLGDRLMAVNGMRLDLATPPGRALVHLADQEVELELLRGADETLRLVVRTRADEQMLRYRDWVRALREEVHRQSQGRLGYVHVPNMQAWGFSEFFRHYRTESLRDGLIVDVRYNGGGNVSSLLLEKLARRRIAYDLPRWGAPQPYPDDSVLGPIVGLTDEHAGSDGDIFSHAFKLMGLGPLVGQRTWGGVIGIWPRHALVDQTVVTQPEFSFWFENVGWGVENYGTDPDIPVVYRPQDYAAGRDPQLKAAIAEGMRLLAERPPARPDLEGHPRKLRPPLPPRQR